MAINKGGATQKAKPVILVVDDQPQNIELLEAYLIPLGYEIVKAANREEALGKLSSNQIDLILLDIVMPGIDGFEVTRRIRQDKKNHLMPIILVTALKEKEDRVKGIEAGCDDFISKPVNKVELFARIRSLLKVKDYNDLMSNYRKELDRRNKELESTLKNLKQEITGRKQAEVVIEEQNVLLQAILNSSNDILIFSLDRNYRYISFNENHRKVMSRVWQADIQIGMNLLECMTAPEPRDAAKSSIDRALAGEQFSEVQYQQIEDIWWEFNWNPICDNNDVVIGVTVFVRDITERERAEGILRESVERFRTLFEAAAEGILITDIETKKQKYANPAICTMLGYSQEELTKMSVSDIHPKGSLEYVFAEFDALARGEKKLSSLPCLKKDGTIFYVEVNASKAIIDGRACTLGFFTDITERKQAEDELIASELRYRRLFETSTDGILIVSPVTGLIIDVNSYLINLLGYSFEEFIGKELWEIGTFKDIIANKEKFKELIEKQYVHYDNFPLRASDGREIWVEFVSNAYEVGQQQVIQYDIRNITERKQMEKEKQQLEEKAQINSRLTAVGEMAAGIAHEINNPLTGVIGFSQLLLEKQNVPDEIKEDLKIIADGSQRVADIVKRLLTFARQVKPVRTIANLNELIENTLKLRDYVLKTGNIDVVTIFDPELPWSMVDPGQLQQVFLNLIVNAEQEMKKAHGKGTLTITTEKKENNIHMSFQDDGPGITQENMRHMFQPFFTTKAPGEGTGLGLSLSRSIILEHGGTMTVESESGHGATFIIELPIIQSLPSEADVGTPTAKVKPKATKKGKILVVDDEPGVRALLEKVLTQSGHSVDTIGDASKALDKLSTGVTYDVILTDVRMPGISGKELYSRIIEKTPEMKNNIIFITGDVMGADIKVFLTQHKLPYLAKPFDIELLKKQIDTIMNAG